MAEANPKNVIAVDLDEVLLNNRVVQLTMMEFDLDPGAAKTWDLKELPDAVRDIIYARFRDPDWMCRPESIIPEAREALSSWARQGFRIVVVTSRSIEVVEETTQFVLGEFPEVSEVFVTGGDGKADLLAEINPTLFIDDAPHNIEDARKRGIRCVLVSNDGTPYNWDFAKESGADVIVVTHVSEIDLSNVAEQRSAARKSV